MVEKKQGSDERDDLDLDAETVGDLEPTEEDADAVRGGGLIEYTVGCPHPSNGCPPIVVSL